MPQAVRDAERFQDGVPAVFHRRNRSGWLVTMRLPDWMELYGVVVHSPRPHRFLCGRTCKTNRRPLNTKRFRNEYFPKALVNLILSGHPKKAVFQIMDTITRARRKAPSEARANHEYPEISEALKRRRVW